MNYKVKLFSGAPSKVEEDINAWLEGKNIEIVQISPSAAITAFPVQTSPLRSLTPNPGVSMAEVQIQSRQLLIVAIVYREVANDRP